MDIHRCRFVPYQPSSINALAFSHASNPKQQSPTDLKLALGRENGDVELWSPVRGQWAQERILRGGVGRTIEQLAWTQDLTVEDTGVDQKQTFNSGPLRLFSTGGSSSVTEWDLEKGVPKRHADGNKGDIWCFAAQPQWMQAHAKENAVEMQASPSQMLVAGCADGSIILFSTIDNELRYDRVLVQPLASKKSRVISITWRDRYTVVAGYEESIIRVVDVRNRRVLRNITLGKSREGNAALIWTVKCLPNGTILSGDSTGELKIWDSQNYSLVQRLKTHNADILDITTNFAGTMILTCGVDRRTVAYASVPNTAGSRTQRWHEVRHRRFHEHDVKAMASFESKSLSIAVSGGMDTVPVVLPLQRWDEEYHRSLSHLPQKPQMSVSSKARLMLTWWARDVFVWHLPPRHQDPSDADSVSDNQTNHKLLAQIQLRGDESITSAEISSSGDMIMAATSTGVKLFQIRRAVCSDGKEVVKSRPLELPNMISSQGAHTVGFSPDCKWLYAVRLNEVILLAKIIHATSSKERPTVLDRVVKLDRRRRQSTSSPKSAIGNYHRHITTVALSANSRILAVGDLSGTIDTWVLEGHESTLKPVDTSNEEEEGSQSDSETDSDDETLSSTVHGQRWIRTPAGSQLPHLDASILVLSFKPPGSATSDRDSNFTNGTISPSSTGYLVAVTSSHQLLEFDVLNCKLSEWSRRNPSTLLPSSFRQIKDRTMGLWWDCHAEHQRLWLYGANFIYMLDISRDLNPTNDSTKVKKRKVGMLGNHVVEALKGHALVKVEDEGEGTKKKKRRKQNAGAGDEMEVEKQYAVKIRAVQLEAGEAGLLSPPESVKQEDIENEDEDEEMVDFEDINDTEADPLLVSRREALSRQDDEESDMEIKDEDEGGQQDSEGDREATQHRTDSTPASWCTFQYRGIFGACVLQPQPSADDDRDGAEGSTPEVVVVERPMYDVELMPRFTNGQDW
ncbi:U3 small nucleolar RNA-associated protein [Neophaeococcomyces mojaviensis]|uniref:U3 small nucleolar RNA-associated protein n=1 Tax=Neophaeococcomyces mojaviensis TaxID=3383035 RepID=A0ACC2ZVI1_9EURO|nr:U3 small nucleolar RNA-associated protein [Knufia sp. JES_112]